jgi:hypothetical protein
VCTLAQTAGHCRVDLLEAIADLGGPAAVAERLCWALRRQTRRPRGYWRNLDNIRVELDQVAFEHRMPHGVIPTKARMRALNRYDVIKAMEAMGGMLAVRTSRMTACCCGTLRPRRRVARVIGCAQMRPAGARSRPLNSFAHCYQRCQPRGGSAADMTRRPRRRLRPVCSTTFAWSTWRCVSAETAAPGEVMGKRAGGGGAWL